jgi:hypothetical protein
MASPRSIWASVAVRVGRCKGAARARRLNDVHVQAELGAASGDGGAELVAVRAGLSNDHIGDPEADPLDRGRPDPRMPRKGSITLDPGPAVDFEFLLQFGDAPPVLLMPGIWPVSIRCWRRQR